MGLVCLGLLLSLGIILLSCELFTNGIELLGKRLKLGDGVVGSIFSAVGTCLPETLIPVIAILFAKSGSASADIGVGAILGAPFMLSTLAFFVTGASVLIFWKSRKTGLGMKVNPAILSRDIKFFIIVYSISILAAFIDSDSIKNSIAAGLIMLYLIYIFFTVKNDGHISSDSDKLLIGKIIKLDNSFKWVVIEIIMALCGIVFGAHIFVEDIKIIATNLGIPAFILSLIITPIATELPEKFNSILWVSKKKDTLAIGNITGAMVFQSCIPMAIGILATPWEIDTLGTLSGLLSILSALLVFIYIKRNNKLTAIPLLMGGVFYLIFIFMLLKL